MMETLTRDHLSACLLQIQIGHAIIVPGHRGPEHAFSHQVGQEYNHQPRQESDLLTLPHIRCSIIPVLTRGLARREACIYEYYYVLNKVKYSSGAISLFPTNRISIDNVTQSLKNNRLGQLPMPMAVICDSGSVFMSTEVKGIFPKPWYCMLL